ncbi:MAG: cation-translocating P-type ATPase, partial [Dehalococcoidia bacterium]
MERQQKWHALPREEAILALRASEHGLSQEEAERRLAEFGPNELQERERVSPLAIFLAQFKSILIIILLAAVVVSALLGEVLDATVIFAIVLASAVLGFVQEYRAERAMEALKQMAAPTASVLRDGEERELAARELVPGDVILVKTGDRIPADSRLVEAINLRSNEASLTGESVPVEKMTEAIPQEELPVGDRKNMVFMGTAATYGRGRAMVVATGMATEFGKIAEMLQVREDRRTPLQISLDKVGKWLGAAALSISALVAVLGIIRGHGILEMFIWGVSLAVAAVPEALPAVVTISLAIGVRRMVKRHALIRKLTAVEALGRTTFICSDKTGTLTQDEMTVRRLYVNGQIVDVTGVGYEPKGEFHVNGQPMEPQRDEHLQTLLRISALCNDSHLIKNSDGSWGIKGDPTEGSLVAVAAKAGIWEGELGPQLPRVDEVPFSSESKRMTTIHAMPQGKLAYAKGAPEMILDSCSHIYQGGREEELGDGDREGILEVGRQMAAGALRVLAMAYKPLPETIQSRGGVESGMVFVGLAGMIDPPREEAKEAVRLCQQAGMKSVMITGDHKLTAMAVAEELGLLTGGVAL